MPVTHTNRRGQTYYLHERSTQTGGVTYTFSRDAEREVLEAIPEGFEIYETPNGQVYLRRVQPKVFTDAEIAVVERRIAQVPRLSHYRVDVKGDAIVVYGSEQELGAISAVIREFDGMSKEKASGLASRMLSYAPALRFLLIDAKSRTFSVERFGGRRPTGKGGTKDIWYATDATGPLDQVAKTVLH